MPGEYDLNDFLSRPAPTMLQALRDRLAIHHADSPHRNQLVQLAVNEIEAGLAKLGAFGHYFHLVEGHLAEPIEWPKMAYHASRAPQGVEVLCQQDFDALDAEDGGWATTPQEARERAGMAAGLRRGGLTTGTALAPLAPAPAQADPGPATSNGPSSPTGPAGVPPNGKVEFSDAGFNDPESIPQPDNTVDESKG